MRVWVWLMLATVGSPVFAAPAATWADHSGSQDAQRAELIGRTITDVRVDIAGVATVESAVLSLVETRVGEPLAMRHVRATIDHLVGLSRFEDVRVTATSTDQGVSLQWHLIPIRRIAKISVTGDGLPASVVRADVVDRFGTRPSATRVPEIVARVQSLHAGRGFLRAAVSSRLSEDKGAPERAELILNIDSGPRMAIGSASVTGASVDAEADVIRQLELEAGRPFDQVAIDARIAAYEESLRGRGYYEARVRESHVPIGDQQTVAVAVTIEPGPRVSVMFAGDPPPASRGRELVPVREERSIDQDLLEDASARIENLLKEQGYRTARAPYSRESKGNEQVVTFTVARGPLHRIDAITTAGNERLSDADLAPLLQLKPGDPFVDARIGLVTAAIGESYRVRGFSQAAVRANVQVLPESSANGVTFRPVSIRFDITEGPQTVVTGVEFEGVKAIAVDALKGQMALQAGRPFYRPQLSADRDTIERAYRNQGFQNVTVTSQLAFAEAQQQVALTWMITEGEQVTVDHVLINGNSRIATDLIRRELAITPGRPISDDAMIESQRRLAELGLFRRVRITELPRSGSLSRDVLVDVEETDATTIDYGGGFEIGRIAGSAADRSGAIDKLDVGPRGFFAFTRRNLWGKNRSVTLFGRVTLRRREPAAGSTDPTDTGGYGFNDYRGLFTFREPRAFKTTGDAQFTAFVEQGRRSSFTFNRRGVTSDYARRIGTFTVTGRYTFDYTRLFDEQIRAEDQLLIDRLFPQVKLSKFFGAVLRDSRDDVLDPQKGSVLGVDGTVAAKVIGSEVGFVKSFMQAFVYRRLPGRGFVLAAGARLGVASGFPQPVPLPLEIASRVPVVAAARTSANMVDVPTVGAAVQPFPTVIHQLPASERFFAGGDTTVRGFALDRLGTAQTLDPQGFPQGGSGMAIFNVETRAPYWKNVQMVWFLDAGNVFKSASDIRLDDLRVSSGLGVRYRSPIGPLRIDWGWKLSTRLLLTGGRERGNVLHISLGQAF